MANPNIVGVTSIYGKVTGVEVGNTATVLVSNSAASGLIYKINNITVTNIDGVNAADITVEIYKNQATSYYLASTITVPADASLVVISKDTSIYLEENDSVRVTASATGDLQAICSYETISAA